jgi:hypothetical protein
MTTESLNFDTALPADHPMLVNTVPETNPNFHVHVSAPETIKVQVDIGLAFVISAWMMFAIWLVTKK